MLYISARKSSAQETLQNSQSKQIVEGVLESALNLSEGEDGSIDSNM